MEQINRIHLKLVQAQQQEPKLRSYEECVKFVKLVEGHKTKLTELHKKLGIAESCIEVDGKIHRIKYDIKERKCLDRSMIDDEILQNAMAPIEAWYLIQSTD